jgi:hypothetical protein
VREFVFCEQPNHSATNAALNNPLWTLLLLMALFGVRF